MNLLLDTHVFLWWRGDDRRLTKRARGTIASADTVFVSVASAWEVAIKLGLGKLRLPEPFSAGVDASGFARLTVTFEHAEVVASLPRHHGDPFDRMIIAQAVSEGLTVVTADAIFERYGVALERVL